MNSRAAQNGLGFLEVILFMSLFVLMVGLLSPMVIQQIVNKRIESTREEMERIQTAIIGDLKLGTYGFAGDLGRFPVQLRELRTPAPGSALFSISNINGVGMGWNGPYINFGENSDDYLLDGFGTPYDYGQAGSGQLRSAGPDLAMGTADDILVPLLPLNLLGRLSVTVRAFDGQVFLIDPPQCSVSLYYAENGTQRFVVDSTPPFVFENIPRGLHALSASCGSLNTGSMPGTTLTVAIQGFGQTNTAELNVPYPVALATTARETIEPGTDDPLAEARAMITQQRVLVQERTDVSPALKSQFEKARSRVLSSIDLAFKQRASQDRVTHNRNIERALSELQVMYGLVRGSALGNGKNAATKSLLAMEGKLEERLTRSLPPPPTSPPHP